MKLEQQTDGTYLASQVINGRVKLSEGPTGDEAWHGLVQMIDDEFRARLEREAS